MWAARRHKRKRLADRYTDEHAHTARHSTEQVDYTIIYISLLYVICLRVSVEYVLFILYRYNLYQENRREGDEDQDENSLMEQDARAHGDRGRRPPLTPPRTSPSPLAPLARGPLHGDTSRSADRAERPPQGEPGWEGRGASGCTRSSFVYVGRGGLKVEGGGRRARAGAHLPARRRRSCSSMKRAASSSVSRRLMAAGGGRQAGSGRRHGPRGPGAPAVTPRLAAGHAPAGDSRGRASRGPIGGLRAHHVAAVSTNHSGRLLNAIDARVAGSACDAARFVYCL
ncbi:unnamed protein product [Danaus chrysippus]|uniref:(African queen) hypothetical protein n=1 Tax=Danaus chrysippus TaxID=151541 RepID=A0A8J2QD05_9NEOP|nr:unnamed protein product [Danaus chrysippus]